jgi:hypothetical protein
MHTCSGYASWVTGHHNNLVEDQARDHEFGRGSVGNDEDGVIIARHLEPKPVETCPDSEIRLERVSSRNR